MQEKNGFEALKRIYLFLKLLYVTLQEAILWKKFKTV